MKWMFNITMVFLFLFIGLTEAHAAGSDCPEALPSYSVADVPSSSPESAKKHFHAAPERVKDMLCETVSHTFVRCNLAERYARYLNELNDHFLRNFIASYAMRERILLCEKERLFPSISFHCVEPSCEYFVFALRKIII